jgi:hypothetical protein
VEAQYPQLKRSLEWRKTRHGLELHWVEGKYRPEGAVDGIKRMIRQHESGTEIMRA